MRWGWLQIFILSLIVTALAFTIVELAWEWRKTGSLASIYERCSNWLSLVMGELLRAITLPAKLALFTWVASHACLTLRASWLVVAACYVLTDLLYYVIHYFLHTTRIGWAFHSVHHTAPTYDLSVPFRLSWIARVFDDLFYLPLVLIGFPPMMVLMSIVVNLFSQIWIHTEMIGRLPGLDWLLNTPANHRVHHHDLPGGRRMNYGGNFMVWDHLFGTYEAETSRKPYGSDLGNVGPHPIDVQLAGLRRLFSPTYRTAASTRSSEARSRS